MKRGVCRSLRSILGRLGSPERFEPRQMLAVVGCISSNNVVTIETDDKSTSVTATVEYSYDYMGMNNYSITVNDLTAKRTWNFKGPWFERIEFLGGKGNDSFTVSSSGAYDFIPIKAWGGGGNDTLRGGLANDDLRGGPGHDTISGGNGDDLLMGEEGNDTLSGDMGDDRLYGGTGTDKLNGGGGCDGLIGGVGDKDELTGGTGADRFVTISKEGTVKEKVFVRNQKYYKSEVHRWKGKPSYRPIYKTVTKPANIPEDKVKDGKFGSGVAPLEADVIVHLRNPAKAAGVSGVTFKAGKWSDADLLPLDEAFAMIARATNNNRLLVQANGSDPVYIRYAGVQSGAGNVAGWNSNNGESISLNNSAFNFHDGAVACVIHEIGHNWDEQETNSKINAFRDLSGWRTSAASGYVQSTDKQWYHRSNAEFYEDYGRTNPREDYATTFEAYVLYNSGKVSYSSVSKIWPKINNVSEYVQSRTTWW
jgi:Ca2+-binding RTX toxin-like protein